jgi:hypothetical protein
MKVRGSMEIVTGQSVRSERLYSPVFWLMGWLATAAGGVAQAQVAPFETVTTLASDVVPVEREFDIPQAGAGQYRVKLTDIGAQFTVPGAAPLDSVKLVVTRGKTVVATIDGTANAGPVDTTTFDATPGTYAVHVVGKPGPDTGSGPISVLIENVASSAAVLTLGATLSAPETVATDVRTYQAEIDIPTAGNYDLTLTDLQFPRKLEQSGVFVFQAGASAITACLSIPEVVAANCTATRTVALAAGKYLVVAAGALPEDHSSDAGVFSVNIRAASDGSLIHSRTVEIGAVKRVSPESFVLNAGQHSLKLKDLEFPAELTSVSTLIAGAGQVAALATTLAPNVPFTVAADNTRYDVFAYALPDAIEAAGSYEVDVVRTGGTSPLAVVQAVGSATGSPLGYTYAADIATAGAYRAKVADFQFPVALSATRLAVVQGGVVVSKTSAADPGPSLTLDVPNLAVGRTTVIAIVKPATISGNLQNGAFGLELTPAGGTQLVLDVAQGIGPLISVRKVSVTQAGKYDVTLTDLNFPDVFQDLMAVVSRGAQRLGTLIVGSGGGNPQGGSSTLVDFDAGAASYSLTVIAKPASTEGAATYGLSFSQSLAGPSITLGSDVPAVTSGGAAKLTWSTQNATTCTASSTPAGVWSGMKAVSGTETTVALTSATTFKLSCTGAGGRSSEQTVNVTIAAASSSGGGGGGNFGWLGVLGLAVIRGVVSARRR